MSALCPNVPRISASLQGITVQNQTAEVTWNERGVPVSSRFDDPYFSLEDGLAETRHVFLAGNDLPGRFRDGFRIAELGFGSGLNFLTTALAWTEAGIAGQLSFTSFEAFPMTADDMESAAVAFPELVPMMQVLSARIRAGETEITLDGSVSLSLVLEDARTTVPDWPGRADAWFLDGFSPAKNPELWTPELMQAVADHTTPGGTFATYTASWRPCSPDHRRTPWSLPYGPDADARKRRP